MATPEEIDLNLDTVEREKTFKPYAIALDGRRMVLMDPADMDWRVLLEIGENPARFLRHGLSPDDFEFLTARKLPGWKLNKLIKGYMDHYGIDLSRGNPAASSY